MHPTTSQSSGSSSSLLSGDGYGTPYGNYSKKGLLKDMSSSLIGNKSTQNLRLAISNPSDYSIPGVTPGTHIPYAIAGARIYHHTQQITSNNHHSGSLGFGGNRSKDNKKKNGASPWVYSYLKGTLVFGRDMRPSGLYDYEDAMNIERITAAAAVDGGDDDDDDDAPRGDYWFQLVDDEVGKVVWRFKVPIDDADRKFKYEFDRPFFHVFQGSSRKYGFLFDDDKEATVFLNQVNARTETAIKPVSPPAKTIKSFSRTFSIRSHKKTRKTSSSHLIPLPNSSVVSAPPTVTSKYLAHVGLGQTNDRWRYERDMLGV
ncbi:hypothetical protein AGABI2DRAFT_121136 [Agaricus bisporus var. bisporus H97]|uniref:hypothetical protein n=1 Tax=Agaricus bisporus var. bisporus (strain H97 / ATCC MYA-4626 / FGSC 10389) TaxID=936046 RepID=UPI00029F60F0|nr:hypothetical protein AGABI2DRAFT_121136 [Agaricus bisporus var. bisporus H97]EKV43932.1 hypothetical protein AGABI2DRAFT_121136 [Agaricus bisporus var. bisporus H97]